MEGLAVDKSVYGDTQEVRASGCKGRPVDGGRAESPCSLSSQPFRPAPLHGLRLLFFRGFSKVQPTSYFIGGWSGPSPFGVIRKIIKFGWTFLSVKTKCMLKAQQSRPDRDQETGTFKI